MASETFAPIAANAPAHNQVSAEFDDLEISRPRRRLGNWQTSPLGADRSDPDVPANVSAAERAAVPMSSRLGQRRPAPESIEPFEETPVDSASPLESASSRSRIESLIEQIQANPNDIVALTELTSELKTRGMSSEARDIQDRLAAMRANSARPSLMARTTAISQGNPGTQPLTETARMRRQASDTLRKTASLTANHTRFPLDQLGFTIPLPGLSELPADARQLLQQSDDELATGNLLAALDSCIMVIDRVPDYTPIHLRIAEIHARQHSARRARAHAEATVRLYDATGQRNNLWMARRILLHASDSDLNALTALVDSLIDARRPIEVIRYGVDLIELNVENGLLDDALSVSNRLCEHCPGDAVLALANVELLVKTGASDAATDRWERAVAAGADPLIAGSSVAALIAPDRELDHWRILGEIATGLRSSANGAVIQAYERTADARARTPVHAAGRAILLNAIADPSAETSLLAAMTDPAGSDASRAFAAVAIAQKFESSARFDALHTAVDALQTPSQLENSVWVGLVGAAPTVTDLELDLGETLLERGEATEAIHVLKRARARDIGNVDVAALLAEAKVQAGQLGAGLAVLDELAISLRSTGRLDEMASVLRKMSTLAPNNIKVKSRLITAYLQRGFLEEARSELLARASLEERDGKPGDAAVSLQRSADLSWGLGRHEESFSTYQRVVALVPEDAGARSSLVNLYLQKGRISEAAEHQRAVVDISVRSGSKHAAIAGLHQVIGLTPDDATAYYQLGDLLSSMGEHRQAEKVFIRLSQMSPGDHVARQKAAEMALLRTNGDQLTGAAAS